MKMYYRQFFSLELLRQKFENTLKISENLVSQDQINVKVYYALVSAKCKHPPR